MTNEPRENIWQRFARHPVYVVSGFVGSVLGIFAFLHLDLPTVEPSTSAPMPAASHSATPMSDDAPPPRSRRIITEQPVAPEPKPTDEAAANPTTPPITAVMQPPPAESCASRQQAFVESGAVELTFAECGVIAYATTMGRWGVRVAGWIRTKSESLQYSTVSELRDGELGRAGYVYGWSGTVSNGGPCEVRDLGNVTLPVSGLYAGLSGDSAIRLLNGNAAQAEQIDPGRVRTFQVFLFCPTDTISGMSISVNARFFISEGGYWVRHDLSFDNIAITGSVRP